MGYAIERALVVPPLTASNADKPIIRTLVSVNNGMRLTENGKKPRVKGRSIRIVSAESARALYSNGYTELSPDMWVVGSLGVELILHILLSELAKGTRFETEELQGFVDFGNVESCKCQRQLKPGPQSTDARSV